MTRTMVYLPDTIHRALKHLAIERHTSLAKLVQLALEETYKEDIEDLQVGHERFKSYRAHPEETTAYSSYRAKRQKR